ncbi:hypothetical protein [Streptomyces fumanus]|uniref:DUF1871 family protein n=1 Tax=Streptomyces fumanus TaxID=67302 RepID=A0A919DW62_9ACTN|nr:hypothetical protein [Streptomyces fumanus]GHE84647.1 hypothetical protein GCM10018772_04580 [Streptomyces fumanus]
MTATDTHDALRRLLNEWDPLGVADDVQDEYDCLIVPILTLLRSGADRTKLHDFLDTELTEHFGLGSPYHVPGMADRLTTWWTSTDAQEV